MRIGILVFLVDSVEANDNINVNQMLPLHLLAFLMVNTVRTVFFRALLL